MLQDGHHQENIEKCIEIVTSIFAQDTLILATLTATSLPDCTYTLNKVKSNLKFFGLNCKKVHKQFLVPGVTIFLPTVNAYD